MDTNQNLNQQTEEAIPKSLKNAREKSERARFYEEVADVCRVLHDMEYYQRDYALAYLAGALEGMRMLYAVAPGVASGTLDITFPHGLKGLEKALNAADDEDEDDEDEDDEDEEPWQKSLVDALADAIAPKGER